MKIHEVSARVAVTTPKPSRGLNYRILRSRRYRGEVWRGYQASKKRFFYGLKLHLMVTGRGEPVEFFLTPGSWSDTRALKMYQFDLLEETLVTGDKAYNDYILEDVMLDANLNFLPVRKDNSHRTFEEKNTQA